MTTYSPENAAFNRLLEKLQLPGFEGVRYNLFDDTLVIEGSVRNYDAKSRIEREARDAGFNVQNSLRVIPGPNSPEPKTGTSSVARV